MSVTLRRAQFEFFLFGLRACLSALDLMAEHLRQMLAYSEHVRNGGDPNEHRRTHWMTRDDVKAQYRKGK